jgi:membrane protein
VGVQREVRTALDAVRARVEGTTAGRVQRRVVELDLMHQAMVLAALTLTLLIPALITLGAFIPLGDPHGIVPLVGGRLGLSAQAMHDVQSLFGGPAVVRSSTSWVSAAVTLLSAYAWPTALQKGYQLAWQLPSRGLRDGWRPLLWLATLLGGVALFALLGGIGHVGPLPVLVAVLVAPVVFLWAWWTQHLLLGGRVGWRSLLGGALLMTVGLYGLRTGAQLSLSSSIVDNDDRYGPIGIVFVLISWFIGFGVVMLGGALVGAELWDARLHRAAAASAMRASPETAATERASGQGAATELTPHTGATEQPPHTAPSTGA